MICSILGTPPIDATQNNKLKDEEKLLKIVNAIRNYIKSTDKLLLVICLGLSTLSILLLYGISKAGYASNRQIAVQILATGLGVVAAIIISMLDYRDLAELYKVYIPPAVILMLLTYVIGIQRFDYVDDRAWLEIPFIGLTFQPSEILKIAFILSFALHLEKVADSINQINTLGLLCLHGAIPVVMIMAQGDDGSALVLLAVFCMMIFAAGLSWKYISAAVGAVALMVPLIWFSLSDGKKMRVLTVFNPELDPRGYGYQQRLGTIAIGSGEIWGKGLLYDSHSYVPEMHNDFIFSFFSECFGFVGAILLLCVLAALVILILKNGFTSKDPLGRYIFVGVFAVIAFQILVNIGMCLSLMPVIGVTLPLLSAGGTSVTMTYVAIGLVFSVRRHSNQNLFIS